MNKKWNITYYVTTVLFSVLFLFGSYSEIARQQAGVDLMHHLGYPVYLLTILGVGKFLGVVGIWQRFSSVLREWAYAGIMIDLVGAVASLIAVGDGVASYGSAILGIVIVLLSYIALKKKKGVPVFV